MKEREKEKREKEREREKEWGGWVKKELSKEGTKVKKTEKKRKDIRKNKIEKTKQGKDLYRYTPSLA